MTPLFRFRRAAAYVRRSPDMPRRRYVTASNRPQPPTSGELVDALWELVMAARNSAAAGDPQVERATVEAVRLIERCRPSYLAL